METGMQPGIRPLSQVDLAQANAVIEAAVMTWDLPARVKRLSVPGYRYNAHDLEHLTLVGVEDAEGSIVGAWESASTADAPDGVRGLLLHGLYIVPALHGTGIGGCLLDAAIEAARRGGSDGLLVKANPDAQGFFVAKGMQRLSTEDPRRDYPCRFWRGLKGN